jgi:hypothetical protein
MSDTGTIVGKGTHPGKDGLEEWRVRVLPDEDAENPRTAYGNQWTLVMAHRRHTLGDKQMRGAEFAEFKAAEGLNADTCIEVPIYAYEHGGIAFSTARTGQFADEFDAGQIGVAYLPVAKLIEEFGADTPENRATARKNLDSELETYQQYIGGEVYGFVYETRPTGSDEVKTFNWIEQDSCWGFYGSDPMENGMKEHFAPHVMAVLDPPAVAPAAAPTRPRGPRPS